jgi:hypothetical protein
MTSNRAAGGCRHPFAKSISACDTAVMNVLTGDLRRIAAAALGVALLLILVAFGYAAISVQPTLPSLVAAAAAVLIAGAGILYAWREPAR